MNKGHYKSRRYDLPNNANENKVDNNVANELPKPSTTDNDETDYARSPNEANVTVTCSTDLEWSCVKKGRQTTT